MLPKYKKESKALSLLGTLIEENEIQKKFFDFLLDDGERETLEKLFDAEKSNTQLLYRKEESFIQRLRHLLVLGFVELRSVKNYTLEELLPCSGNLNEYFKITCNEKVCLALGSSKVSAQDIVDEDANGCHCHKILKQIIEKQS